MTMDIATLGIRVDSTEARLAAVELDRLGAAGGRTATSMSAAERASERASHQFNAMAGMAKIAAGAIAGIVFSKVVQEVASFETKLLSLKALTNANTSEMKAMEKQARSLGASTAFSAQQTAEAQGVLASAGLKVNEILAATPKVLELAAAGALDLAKAAEISTGTMKGLGLELTDLGRINDVFAKVASDTSTNVEQVGEAMKNVAPIAKAFGINLEDMAASIGVLADNQIKGSEAGNNFKAMLTALGNETKERTNMLKQHGLAYSDLNIQVKGLQPVMDTLRKANLSGAEAITLFGSDAAAAGLILANNAPKIDTFSKALEGASGAAKAQADILNQGLAKAWDALLGTLSEASLQLGDSGLKGSLTDLIAAATGVISIYVGMGEEFAKSNNLTKEQYENLKNIASGLETVAAGAGGIAVLTAGIWAANAAMLAFNLASKANPLVLVATLGAAGIGMVIDKIGQQKKAQEDFMTSANTLDEQNLKIKTQIAKIVSLTPHGGGTGASKETMDIEKKNLEILIGQRTAIEAKTAAEKESAKVTDQANKNKPKEMPKLSGASTEELKAHEKAAKEAAKAQEALAKSFADTLESLSLHNIELSKTTREHKEAELYAKKYTKAMVEQALALYDIGTALAAKKKLNEDEKAQLDSLIDRYNKATMSARAYYETTLTTTGADGQKTSIPSADKAPIMAQFDKTATAEATKKATDDATASLDAYNKKLDDANTKTSDLGAVTSAIFDGALGGISAMAGAFDAMVTSIGNNTKALEENAAAKKLNEATIDPVKKAANFEKYAKVEAKLNNDNVKASLTGASQMAGAAANLFDKKSSAAKAFHNIEIGLSVLRLAMDIKEIASSMTKTAVKTAEGASTMFAQSGWLGFAGVAAMMAVMAGLGFASGGSGGSATPPKSNDGTGTVLGDSSAKSESLAKTNDLLKNIHASEYVELRGINAGVNNLSKSILNTVTQLFQGGGLSGVSLTQTDALSGISKSLNTAMAIGTAGLSILVSKIPLIGGIFDKVNSFLFGGKQTQSVVGQGIETWGTPLNGIISGGNVQAGQYADIKTHTSGGLFGKSKDSYATGYQAVGADIQKALNDVFKNVGTNLMVVAKSLGNNLTDTVKKAIIPAMRVDLMGLSGEDAAKKLNSVIGATMDTMSATIFGKIVGQYQQLGEGMFETAVRIVAEVEIVKDAFAQSGKAMPKLSINAISMADALVQAAGGLEEFQKRFEGFIDKFTTDPEKQTRTRKFLQGALGENNLFDGKQIGSMLNSRDAYGNKVDAAAADVAKYAGDKSKTGMAKEKRAVERYSLLLEMAPKVDEFISYNEKITKDTLDMDIKLAQSRGDGLEVSRLVLKSHESELKLLPEKLRITQQLIWNQETANKQASLDITLMKAQGRTVEALAISRQKELDAMEPSLQATQRQINAMDDLNTAMTASTKNVSTAISRLTSLSDKLKSTMSSIKIETSESLKADRANARALLSSALIIAKAGGAIDNIAGMDKALTDIAKPSEQLYATFNEYARDQQGTSSTISQLAGYADAQVSMAQKQLDAINKTTTAVEVSLPAALAELMGLAAQKNFVGPMPQFASGGYHSGGWRVVGENGPELEQTGASRIFSNPQSKGLLSTDELVAELQALRAEVRAGQEAIANNTLKTAKILRDVTQDGTSITTTVSV